MAEINAQSVYAALGMEMPSQSPGAADPASQGAKDPQLTGADSGMNRQSMGDGTEGRPDRAPAAEDGGTPLIRPSVRTGAPSPEGEGFGGTGDPSPTGEGGRAMLAPTSEGGTGETAPTSDGGTGDPSPTRDGGTGDPSPTEQDGGMSRAERAEQARLRRQREQDAAVKAAVDKALAEERDRAAAQLKDVFAKAGMTDRYNGGKAITSMEEFNAWQAKAQAERLSRELKGGNLTPESFQAAVDNSPAVQAAKAAVERLEAREREQEQARSRAAFDAQVQSELAQIHKLDPSVNSLEDVLNLPTGQEFSRLVTENKLSFLQAFRLANADRMSQAQAMAAAEGAARQGQSKGHLRSIVSPTNSVPVEVPRGTVKIYRDLHPDWTMEQIRQDYARRVR